MRALKCTVILLFIFMLLSSLCVFTVSSQEISVNDGLTVLGAQIRTSTAEKPQAIRFTAKYTDALSEQYKDCEFGFLVIPTKYVPSGESVTVGKRFLYKDRYYKVKKVPAVNIYEDADGYITYTVCITGTKALNYDRNFTVVPYIKNNEGNFLYSSPYTSSLVKVAEAITADATASTTDKTAAKKLLKEHDDAQWTGIYKP